VGSPLRYEICLVNWGNAKVIQLIDHRRVKIGCAPQAVHRPNRAVCVRRPTLGKRDHSLRDQLNLLFFGFDLRVNQWTQFVPVGDALIGRTSVQIIAMPKLMKLPAAGGSDVVRVGSTVIGAKSLDDFDN